VDFIKDYFLEANPNPERVGCPDEATIKALAEDRLPVSHPGRLHLAACSECFTEYRGYRLKWLETRKARRKVLAWAIAASLTLFAAAGGIWESQHLRSAASPVLETTANAPVNAQVDLFNAGTFRGARDEINQLQAVTLPAAVVHLRLTLPRFSDPGRYQILVSRDRSASQIVAKASALTREMNNHEVLDATLDLRSAKEGSYFLATVRHQDSGTYYYPLTVK
jgi:hypothetical protein